MSVALIGSSGGGTATLGHTDPVHLLQTIHSELLKVSGSKGVKSGLFISLHNGKGFDSVNPAQDQATLYRASLNGAACNVEAVQTGILDKVNNYSRRLDKELAKQIRAGEIQGLICISCDVEIHFDTLQAAADMNIPVTGSGGTSLSEASAQFGIRLVGNAGGSVATTSYTRAVSYTCAMAAAWKSSYQAFSSGSSVPSWNSVLDACLPAFWGVCLAIRIIEAAVLPNIEDEAQREWITENIISTLRLSALPTTCCVVMTSSLAPHHGSTAIMAACIASVVCKGSILGGMVGGWIVAACLGRVLHTCIMLGIPATTTNLVVGGSVGVLGAVTVGPIVPYLKAITEAVRWMIHLAMNGEVPCAGFVLGCMFCHGSKIGFYHTVFLPLILMEMEHGDASVLGTIDQATLVLVSAGICAANLLFSPFSGAYESRLCWRGLRTNLAFGDFIEVAYPFMERSLMVNVIGYVASGVSSELLTGDTQGVMSLAYLPCPISVLLAKDQQRVGIAYAAAFGISFLGTVYNNMMFAESKKTYLMEDERREKFD